MQVQSEKVTARRILEVSSKLFAEKGYSNVSIRDLCKAAGTTAPVIYYHFGSKKGLFDAAITKGLSMGDFVDKLAKNSKGGTVKSFEGFVRTYLSTFPEHAFDPGLYIRDSASLDRQSARRISADLDRVRSLASSMVRERVESGEFRKVDPDLAADCLLGMLNRAVFQRIHFEKASDVNAYGKFVAEFFLRAVRA